MESKEPTTFAYRLFESAIFLVLAIAVFLVSLPVMRWFDTVPVGFESLEYWLAFGSVIVCVSMVAIFSSLSCRALTAP